MNESVDVEAVRAEALRKVGRNIVNFSKVEATFKYLLSVSKIDGSGKTISEELQRNQSRLRKKSLGSLVEEFNKNILGDANQSEPTPNFSEVGVSVSVKVTYDDPDFLKVQKRKLTSIVSERNKLIHHKLAFIDTNSVEDCRNLIAFLDEQNLQIFAQIEELKRIIETLREGLKALKDWSELPDFIQSIQSNPSNT